MKIHYNYFMLYVYVYVAILCFYEHVLTVYECFIRGGVFVKSPLLNIKIYLCSYIAVL